MACGHGRGRGGGRGALFFAREELALEEPALGAGATQQLGGGAPPPPPPQLAEVMDRQTHLLEMLAHGMLHCHRGPPNDFQRKLEGFLKLRPPTFDTADDDAIAAKD
jgi:hypothetical protein